MVAGEKTRPASSGANRSILIVEHEKGQKEACCLPTYYLFTQLPKGTRPIWLCWYNCAQWKMISTKNEMHQIFNPLLINHETHFDDGSIIDMYRT